jgi:hypothetical protein
MKRKLKQSPGVGDPRAVPLEGGYYWLPSRGDGLVTWEVLTCHELGFDAEAGHVDFWPAVIDRLAKSWRREPQVLQRVLTNECYGLPRGRVTRPERLSLILHGNDAPIACWQDKVIRRFDLDCRSIKVLQDTHETMLPDKREKVMNILGIDLPEIRRVT